MKIILSKKGFDNTYGKVPSPVFDKEGTKFISMPIPAVNACDEIMYSKIEYYNHNLGNLIKKLGGKEQGENGQPLEANSLCHFDPQLVKNANETNENWKPLFGQAGSAQGQLSQQGIKASDLFLFYGRFQRVNEKTEYIGKPFSAIYGWLRVEKCIDLVKDDAGKYLTKEDKDKIGEDNPCITKHPHFDWHPKTKNENNAIYTAQDAGLFDRLYILTEANVETNIENRNIENIKFSDAITDWILPKCLSPLNDVNVTLSSNAIDATYNKGAAKRWKENNDETCKLRAYGRNQEFILNYDNATEDTKTKINKWVRDLFA